MSHSNESSSLPVLVVGAGPTGLTFACELLRHGVRCRVIDKLAVPSDKSKALAVHARTLEILENMKAVDAMLASGIQAHGFSLYNGETRIMHVSAGELDSPFPFILMIPQDATEKVLFEHLQALGGHVERGVELIGMTQDKVGVTATLKHPDGKEETVICDWLVGCDGAHSSVRKFLNLPFEGSAYEEQFALADVIMDSSLPEDEISTFFHEDGALVFFPMGNKRFRVIANVDESKIVGDEPTLEFMQSTAASRGPKGVKFTKAIWLSWFRIHARSVPKYRVGRAFLAGDAAHIHSPVGGQGMNTGMQDVYNLAWKLALVVHGDAAESLLDSYQDERHPIGLELLKGTDMATKVAILRNPLAKQIRNHVMSFLGHQEVIVNRIRKMGTMMLVNYRKSPIVGEHREAADMHVKSSDASEAPTLPSWIEFARAHLPGDRAPDMVMFDLEKRPVRLYEAMQGTRHNLLLFDGKPTEQGYHNLEKLAQAISERYGSLVAIHLIVADETLPTSLSKFPGNVYLDPEFSLHHAYGAGTESLYLIRPDGYIGFRSQPAKLEPLEQHLSIVLGKTPAPVR